MSDQLVLDLDGYCPPAPSTTAATPAPMGYSIITGGTSGNVTGIPINGSITGVGGGGGGATTSASPLWYPVYGYVGGTLPPVTPVVIGIDYGTKPATPKEKNKDGCTCKKCQEFFPYAESNQDDGTLICYGCKLWM